MTTDRAAISAAYSAGRDFAAELNATPAEAQNWRPLERGDELPTEDYVTLRREHGDVTAEMAQAYRDGFNSGFNATLRERHGQ